MEVLVVGDGSFVVGEGTCDGSIAGVVLSVGGICFSLFIDAGGGCLNEVFKD